jgi:1-deoxy-D-xylulose-5-phosphate synthase
VFDVGIAEQHAVTSAAGMAFGGLHPIVAVYATFINRAFDQVLMDVGLHQAGVTFVLDRAGITGDDGASHHGMWDLSLLRLVPGIRIAAPRDGVTLVEELREAVAVDDAPTVVRFPKGEVPAPIRAVQRIGGVDVLRCSGERDVLLVAVGAMVPVGLEVADRLAAQGIGVTVIDPRWVVPVEDALMELALVRDVVVETISAAASARLFPSGGTADPYPPHGAIPRRFLEQASAGGLRSWAVTMEISCRWFGHCLGGR